MVQAVEFPAFFTVVPENAAVELVDGPAPGGLVEPVDILGHHRQQLPLLLPFRQLSVGCVWLCVRAEHFRPVKAKKFFGIAFIEGMA